MFNNVAFDVCIGLIFIFLLYSLLATTINEFVAMIFAYRHRMLEKAIEQMLDGKNYSYYWWDKLANIFLWIFRDSQSDSTEEQKAATKKKRNDFLKTYRYDEGVLASNQTSEKRVKVNEKAKLFAANIINHPLYRRKSEQSLLYKKPAYLSASAFSDILFDVLSNRRSENNATPILMNDIKAFVNSAIQDNADLKSILNIYIEQANGDVQKFKLLLEDWFDDTMDRASGWYKRQATKVLFAIGLVLAFAFNVSTIAIVNKLSVNKDLRETMAKSASAYVENANRGTNPPNSPKANSDVSLADTKTQINNIKALYNDTIAEINMVMGLGWGDFGYKEKYAPVIAAHRTQDSIYVSGLVSKLPKMAQDRKILFYKNQKPIDSLKVPADSQKARAALKAYLDAKHKTDGHAGFFEKVVFIFRHVSFTDLLGFIITALAITLGAPFWFDLLNKFINVRAGGNKPSEDAGSPGTKAVSKTVTLNQKPDPKSFA